MYASSNDHIPINRIPLEILCHTFRQLATPGSTLSVSSKQNIVSLLLVSSVCQYWRRAAITNAVFWADIKIESQAVGALKLATLFLERSNGASLAIAVSCGSVEPPNESLETFLLQLQKEGHRLRAFSADMAHAPEQIGISDKLTFSAPILESLELTYPIIPHSEWSRRTAYPPFNATFPSLRRLELQNHVPWPAELIVNLTTLTLNSPVSSDLVTIDAFLHMLRNNISLTSLELHGYELERPNKNLTGCGVALQDLKKIGLFDCNSRLILSLIAVPHPCHVQIGREEEFMSNDDLDPDEMTVMSALPPGFMANRHLKDISRLEFHMGTYPGIEIRVNCKDASLQIYQGLEEGYQETDECQSYCERSLDAISHCPAFKSARAVQISNYLGIDFDMDIEVSFPPALWQVWFTQLCELEQIETSYIPIEAICLALITADSGKCMPCQKLHSVEFRLAVYDAESARYNMETVEDLVRKRMEVGFPIQKIKVEIRSAEHSSEDCDFGIDDWRERLGNFVAEVDLQD